MRGTYFTLKVKGIYDDLIKGLKMRHSLDACTDVCNIYAKQRAANDFVPGSKKPQVRVQLRGRRFVAPPLFVATRVAG